MHDLAVVLAHLVLGIAAGCAVLAWLDGRSIRWPW
jgi:hypothetical protein